MTKPKKTNPQKIDKSFRANASQFFVAAELCRREYVALVTMGNTPNTDVLVSNREGTKFVHVQVKTYKPQDRTVSVGKKAEKNYGKNFIWILAGIPTAKQTEDFEYYIVPSRVMSKNVTKEYQSWLKSPGIKGQKHNPTDVRTVRLPNKNFIVKSYWLSRYKNAWIEIEKLLR